jgi:uncharacterized protein involved in outer membrane biogenesis
LSRKRRLAGAAIAIVGVLIALAVSVRFIDFGRFRERAERELSSALGLEVSIRGDFYLDVVPRLQLATTDVTVANLEGRPSPHLAEIGSLQLELSTWELLFGAIEIDGLNVLDAEIRIETDAEGRFGLAPARHSLEDEPEAKPLDLRIHSLDLENVSIFYRAGESGTVTSLRVDALSLEADTFTDALSLAARGEIDGSPFDITGRLGRIAQLLEPTAPYPFSFSGRVFEAELELDGTAEVPLQLRGLDLWLSATLPDLAILYREPGRKLPRIGPVHLAGRLSSSDGKYSVADLTLSTASSAPIGIEITGTVADLRAIAGVDLHARLEADDLRILEPFVERKLPEMSVTGSARVEDRDGTLGIEGEVRGASRDGAVTLEVAGGHDDLSRLEEIDVQVDLRARDLKRVGEMLALEVDLPPIGPLVGHARLRDQAGTVGVHELDVELGRREETWGRIEGSVGDLARFEGVHLEAAVSASDLRHARPYLEREPPEIGPIRGEATLEDDDGTLGVERFTLRGGRKGVFSINLSGAFEHVRELDHIWIEAQLEARDLGVLGEIFGADLPPIGSVEFSGRVKGSDEQIVSQGTARLDKTVFIGNWSASFTGGARPSMIAKLESPHLHLDDIGIEPRRAAPARGGPAALPPPSADRELTRWWAGAKPIPFDKLRILDADFELRAARITGRKGFEIREAAISGRLEGGLLEIPDAHLVWEGGTVEGEARVDVRAPVPSLGLRARASGLDVARLMSQVEEKTDAAGIVNGWADLESSGSSRDQIRSALAGRIAAATQHWAAAGEFSNMFVRELAFAFLPSLRLPSTPIFPCLLTDFDIDDGVATVRTLVLQGDGVTIDGTGSVDLGREEYDLRLTPTVRDPGLLSIAATVDVSGSLDGPEFRPLPRSLATSAVRGVLSNALRPAAVLVQPLLGARETVESGCALPADSTPE